MLWISCFSILALGFVFDQEVANHMSLYASTVRYAALGSGFALATYLLFADLHR